MFRGIMIIAVLLTLVGCKTTSDSVASIDKVRGEIAIQTSDDSRSALERPADVEAVRSVEKSLQRQAKKDPSIENLLSLAEIQLSQKKLDEARKTSQRILRKDMKNKQARVILAQVAMREGNIDLASIILASVGNLRKKDSNVLNMLAMIAFKRNSMAEAMTLWKQAIKINPYDVAPRMNLGVMQVRFRQLSAAATQFERVLKIMPNNNDAKLHLAVILDTRGNSSKAQELLEEVLASDQKNPLALFNLAVVQKNGEDYDDALENLKSYLKSQRTKSQDNDRVFALIDEIQKIKAADGDAVSDSEIQAMAANMGSLEEGTDVASAQKPKQRTKPVVKKAKTKKTKKAASPAKSKDDSYDYTNDTGEDESADDIDSLEKALGN